jgi:hypothetical protein
MQQWPALLHQVNRREAKRLDADSLYPLHWACSGGAPLDVVEALLEAYPRAARKVDSQGSTVLHFACHYGTSAAVVDILIKAYPRGTQKQDKFGRTPLWHAVSKSAGFDVIKSLVEADPSSITKACAPPNRRPTRDPSGSTPLFFAWFAVLKDRQAHTRCIYYGKKWEKAEYLLKMAFSNQVNGHRRNKSSEDFKLIPAVITMFSYLPAPVLELAVKGYPQQLDEVHELTGLLPLSMAASLVHPSKADDVIRVLLDANKRAAHEVDSKGRSALSLGLESGKRWDQGVERLFHAAPEALGWIDGSSNLPAVALCAAAMSTSDTSIKDQNPAADDTDDSGLESVGSMQRKHLDLRNSLLQHLLSGDSSVQKAVDPDTQHLSTIYQLLLEDPSIMACASK